MKKIHDIAIEQKANTILEKYYIRIVVDFDGALFRLRQAYMNEKDKIPQFVRLDLYKDGRIYNKFRNDYVGPGNDAFACALEKHLDKNNWLKTNWKKRTETCRIKFWIRVNKIEDIVKKNWNEHRIYCSTRLTNKDKWNNQQYTDLTKRNKYRRQLISDLHWMYGMETKEIANISKLHIDTVRRACNKYKEHSLRKCVYLLNRKRDSDKI